MIISSYYCFFCYKLRYVAKEKGILQPHDLLDEVEKIVKEDEGMQKLKDSPFVKALESAKVSENEITTTYHTSTIPMYYHNQIIFSIPLILFSMKH